MTKSDFSVAVFGELVVIVDLNLGNMSVTNDIDAVLQHISKRHNFNNSSVVVYRDSDGHYDRVGIQPNGKFRDFNHFRVLDHNGRVLPITDLLTVIEILRESRELNTIITKVI